MKDLLVVQRTTPSGIARLSTSGIHFNTAAFWGYNSFDSNGVPNWNSAPVFLGTRSGSLPIMLPPGGNFNWELGGNKFEDLSNFYFNAVSGDGVYAISYV